MKAFYKILSAALLLCTFAASCSGDSTEPEPTPNPSEPVQGDEIVVPEDTDLSPTISQDGDSKTIRFTAKEPWQAYVADTRAAADWLHVTPTSGKAGEVELTITTDRNEEPDDRAGYVKIVSGNSQATISVTQKQRDALTVSPSKRTIDAQGTEFEIEVRANIDFEVEVRADWIEQIATRALTTTVLRFRAKKNIEDERTGTIIIRSGEKSETITITQEKGGFIVDTEQIRIDAAEQNISAKVRANIDFEVEVQADWIEQIAARALTTTVLQFKVKKNIEDERTGEIVIRSGKQSETITVIQEKGTFIVDTEQIDIDAAAQSVSAKVRANIDFEVEPQASWIHYNPTRAMTSYTLSFDIDENTTGKERTGEITVSGNGKTETITIIQSNEAFDVEFDKTEVSNEGGTITATVNSNLEYDVVLPDNADWLTCVDTRAVTTRTHNFKIEANPNVETRSAIIKFVYQSEKGEAARQITITQQASDIGANRTLYELGANGERLDIRVQGNTSSSSDIEYYITKGVEWISRIETRAVTAYFTFNIDKNTTGKLREGEIEFTLPDKTNTKVRIVQSATDNTVYFPDENFKAYMVANFDKNEDGEISEYEASLITKINCSDKNIESLEGIQHCTALTSLFCLSNQLTNLDVSKNTALTELYCYGNPIEVLNLGDVNPSRYYYDSYSYKDYPYFDDGRLGSSSKLKVISTKITELKVSSNKLQSLDVSECPALTELYCSSNQLTTLDVNKNTALTSLYCSSNQLTTLDVNKNTALTSLYCSYNQLTSLDVSKNTALTKLGCYSNPLELLNLGDVLLHLDLNGRQLGSTKLKVISTKITELNVSKTKLQSLDVSECPALTELYYYGNPLEVLNLGDVNPSRYYYDSYSYTDYPYFHNGRLGSSIKLKVISTKITRLDVSKTKLQSLDVSECPALTELYYYGNPLEVLNLGDVNPSYYYYNYNSDTNSYLYKDYPYFRNGWLGSSTKLKVISTKITKLDVSSNNLQSLDVSECPALTELDYNGNPLEVLNLGNVNSSYYSLKSASYKDYPEFYSKSSTKLKVISTKITKLDVSSNNLQSLDVSECPALTELYCYSNQLTTLDVSKNIALTRLDCYSNQLTTLDVSKNIALTRLYCYSNQLTTLDVSKNIALTRLDCYFNQLTTLDVSKNTALTQLYCYSNQLTTLDVSKNIALTRLDCYFNQLTTLDVGGCTALTYLLCFSNPLEVLNLGDVNPSRYYYGSASYIDYPYFCNGWLGSSTKLKVISTKITKLNVSSNNLQSLDVSECPALTELYCSFNQLTTLDVSKTNIGNSTKWYPLDCSDNSTLQTLYLKTGWKIGGINVGRDTYYIPSQTEILYKD